MLAGLTKIGALRLSSENKSFHCTQRVWDASTHLDVPVLVRVINTICHNRELLRFQWLGTIMSYLSLM